MNKQPIRKFIDSIDLNEWEIETPEGFETINSLHVTIEYDVYRIELENNLILECADTHILFDEYGNEIFAKNCIPWSTRLKTKQGTLKVLSVNPIGRKENMYDFELEKNSSHTYYTNDILSHNTICVSSFALWQLLFNEYYKITLLANKEARAKGNLRSIKLMYRSLPFWLQQGVIEWNKTSIELENNSMLFAAATSESSARGDAINHVIMDEFAFVRFNLQEEFMASAYPTLASGQTTKLTMISTPKGMEMFYKFWTDAKHKRNGFYYYEINWNDIPGRDEEWKAKQIATIGQDKFDQEFGAEFIGSQNTLIDAKKIRALTYNEPIADISNSELKIYEPPKDKHTYTITVDCSEGVKQDYSVIHVFDVSEIPYKQVALYRSNTISTYIFPEIIHNLATKYNRAFVLIELESIGMQVANDLYKSLEYDNIIRTLPQGRSGQKISFSYNINSRYGIKMSNQVKRIGCSQLKSLIEYDKLLIQDFDTITELASFIKNKNSWEAEEGKHDDIVMTLVLFAWLASQNYFKDLIDKDVRSIIVNENKKYLQSNSLLTTIKITDGSEDYYQEDNTLSQSFY